jgi:hypothetical protein
MRVILLPILALLAACGDAAAPVDPGGPSEPTGQPPTVPGASPRIGGCDIFPADNPWNRDVSEAPVDPASDALIAAMSPDAALHLDLGTAEEYYGIPFSVVPASQPTVPIVFGTDGVDYSDESDPGPMPIPLDAPIEGGSTADPDPSSGDRHVLVLQEGSCRLYELYNTQRVAGGFRVSSSAIWNLTVNDSRPAGWTSADAAGLPILPGLLRHQEAAAGEITHALRFTMPMVRRAYVAPASHCGSYSSAARPPYGLRVRLKASVNLSGYSGTALVLLTALKRYGLMLADQGSPWYVTGTSDPGWANALDQLRDRPIYGRDFEVVQMGPITTC